MKLSNVILIALLFAFAPTKAQELIKVDESDKNKPVFYVSLNGIDDLETLSSSHKLHTVVDGTISKWGVISSYSIKELAGQKVLCLQPDYPLNSSVAYTLKLNQETISYAVKPDISEVAETEILTVYPMADELPANVLTFYIEFDKPMRPDKKAFGNISLVRDDGTEIEDVWRHRAVWQNNNTVLALMIHPGRIKKGIHSTSELETVFTPGENIHIKLKSGLLTQKGNVLEGRDVKSYSISTDGRKKVDKKVKINNSPTYNSKQPLIIAFNSQMDFGLVNKWVVVQMGDNKIAGTLSSKDDFTWEFYPSENWDSGKYDVSINYQIGDPSHNSMNRLFEEETIKSFEKEVRQNKQLSLHFTIK